VTQRVVRSSELGKRSTSVYLRIPDILRSPAIIFIVAIPLSTAIILCLLIGPAIAPIIIDLLMIRGLSLFILSLVTPTISLLICPSDLSL
jgi:hypothetical protein